MLEIHEVSQWSHSAWLVKEDSVGIVRE
jgi:hypothetical protein